MDGRSIPLDWSEPRFDRLFFECFEELLRKYIQQQHPEWPSYPYHGSRLDAQMKREREALEKKIRQQKEAAANAAANAAASAAQTAPGVGTPTPHPPSQTTFSSSSFPSSHSDGLPRKSLSQGKIGPGDPSRGSLSPRDHRSVPLQSSSSSTGRILDPARWMSSSASSSSSSSHRTAKEGEEWTSSTPAATKGRERPNREAFSSSQNQGSTATRATRFAAG
ncbi:phosphatidylinositol 3- and 4-kinase [Cystoisospora suis]|uniref:Phosphatidylinositol 3-and 4-kinase n=1 Tax=Cystoisospora suis TaxID=483139 RepID=A0A2C6KNF0_9APIC|nr:phosphatidylinositol 3- and 4-kinase [Cystoisospora suis]